MTVVKETWKGLASEQTLVELSDAIVSSVGTLAKVTASITRPADTTTYTGGDLIAPATAHVKQVSTVTLTGGGGLATITGTGGLTKTVTFALGGTQNLAQTATDFVTSFATAYDELDVPVTITAVGDTIVFTAKNYDTVFVAPVITNVSDTLSGAVTHTAANRAAVAQVETITITGTAATKQKETVTITGVAGQTQAETVTLQATPPTKMKVTIPLAGTLPVAQVEDITLTGSSGTLTISGTGGFTNLVTWTTDLAGTAAAFANPTNIAEYATAGITLSNSTTHIIFTAATPGTPFTAPTITAGDTDLGGTVAHTANVVAGTANLTVVGLSPKLITFTTDLSTTADNFVTSWATSYYLGQGVVVTAVTGSLILETTTLGVPFGIPDVVTLTGNLTHGTIDQTVAHVAVGTATITAGATFSATATYNTSIAQTCIDFDSAPNKASALANGIVLTHSGDTLIFTANVKGTGFTSPDVTTLTGDLIDTSIVVDQVNVPLGTANMTLAGGLTKLITYDTDAATTVSNFVDIGTNVADYLAVNIVLTHSGDTIVMEAKDLGGSFTAPVVDTAITGTCAGSVVETVAPVPIGTGTITGIGTSKTVTFNTTATQTATDFKNGTGNIAYYATLGVTLSSSGADIIFTAVTAGTGFTSPVFTNTAGDIAGTLASTATKYYANVTAIKQVETVLITGTSGSLTVTAAGSLSKTLPFTWTILDSINNFVIANAAAYLAANIVLTGTATQLVFTAQTAGTGFTAPVITNITDNLAGTVVSTPNISLIPITLSGVGSSGFIKDLKIDTSAVQFAGKVVRLWLFDTVPTGVVGDNEPYISLTADATKRNACPYIDVTFDALLTNSTTVVGKAHPDVSYVCATGSTSMYALLQSIDGATTPATGGVFTIALNVLKS